MKYVVRYRICIAGTQHTRPGEAHAKIVAAQDDYSPWAGGSVDNWTYNEHDEIFTTKDAAIAFAKKEPRMQYTEIYDVTHTMEPRWQTEWNNIIWSRDGRKN